MSTVWRDAEAEHLAGGVQGARLVVGGHHDVDPVPGEGAADGLHHEVHHAVVHAGRGLVALVDGVLVAELAGQPPLLVHVGAAHDLSAEAFVKRGHDLHLRGYRVEGLLQVTLVRVPHQGLVLDTRMR